MINDLNCSHRHYRRVCLALISQAFPSRAGQESVKNEQTRSLPAIGSRSRNKLEKCGLDFYNSQGSISSLLAFTVFITMICTFLVYFVFGEIVPPNYLGVRQNKLFFMGGSAGGFANRSLAPGLHWKIPGVSEIVLLPRDIQIINFNTANPRSQSQLGNAAEPGNLNLSALDIPATNGSKIVADISLLVRLFENDSPRETPELSPSLELATDGSSVPLPDYRIGKHGGPRNLITDWDIRPQEQLRRFATTVQDALIKNLSRLSTIEFYNPVMRESAAIKANHAANILANPHGVAVLATLVRRYTYDASIDDQIFAKNLQETAESLNAATSELAKAKAATEKIRATWDAKILDLKVKGKGEADVTRSKGELYEAQAMANGNLAVASAKAHIEKTRAEVLQTEGAESYTAQRLTPFLQSLQGGIVSGLDPYNVDEWVKKLSSK